jgi:hypothetical protein
MDDYERAMATLNSSLYEIKENCQIRQAFTSLFFARSGDLYAWAGMKEDVRSAIERTLKLKDIDPTVAFRGMYIQAVGCFEMFVKQFSASVADAISNRHDKFSDIDGAVATNHTVLAAKTLAYLSSGSVNGVDYDFLRLQRALGSCLSNISEFRLDGHVYTATMGNCTADRIRRLFEQLGLGDAFGPNVTRHKEIKRWTNNAGSKEAEKLLSEKMDLSIKTRNNIAHGFGSVAIVVADVLEISEMYRALAESYCDLARTVYAS